MTDTPVYTKNHIELVLSRDLFGRGLVRVWQVKLYTEEDGPYSVTHNPTTGSTSYKRPRHDGDWGCECPQHLKYAGKRDCEHIRAVKKETKWRTRPALKA